MKKNTSVQVRVMRFIALTAIAAALVFFFFRVVRANQTTVAFAFLVMVLFTAYRWRFAYSIFASLLCGLLYNYFFLPPVGRLTVADPQNLVALSSFLIAS